MAVYVHRHDSERNECFLLFVGPASIVPHTMRVRLPSSMKSSENTLTECSEVSLIGDAQSIQ